MNAGKSEAAPLAAVNIGSPAPLAGVSSKLAPDPSSVSRKRKAGVGASAPNIGDKKSKKPKKPRVTSSRGAKLGKGTKVPHPDSDDSDDESAFSGDDTTAKAMMATTRGKATPADVPTTMVSALDAQRGMILTSEAMVMGAVDQVMQLLTASRWDVQGGTEGKKAATVIEGMTKTLESYMPQESASVALSRFGLQRDLVLLAIEIATTSSHRRTLKQWELNIRCILVRFARCVPEGWSDFLACANGLFWKCAFETTRAS